jgi:hypothetical protein
MPGIFLEAMAIVAPPREISRQIVTMPIRRHCNELQGVGMLFPRGKIAKGGWGPLVEASRVLSWAVPHTMVQVQPSLSASFCATL